MRPICLYFLCALAWSADPRCLHVAPGGAGGDGLSWAQAFPTLQQALAVATPGDQVWVAAGTYCPGTVRTATFLVPGRVTVLGGFAGGETSADTRDPLTHPTILSGDIGVAGDPTDNVYHVVSTTVGEALLDGVVIRDGCANGGYPNDRGAGIYSSTGFPPHLTNCQVLANQAVTGAGMWCSGAVYSVYVTSTIFRGNTTSGDGGALVAWSAVNPMISRCVFDGNRAGGYGGAISLQVSNTNCWSCVFIGNQAAQGGALAKSTAIGWTGIYGCTFVGNAATTSGGAIWSATTQPNYVFRVASSIIRDNSAPQSPQISTCKPGDVADCDIAGGCSGALRIIDVDSVFVAADQPLGADGRWMTADDGLCLGAGSPCIDQGTYGDGWDVLDRPRSQGRAPDMGAYESPVDTTPPRLTLTAPAMSAQRTFTCVITADTPIDTIRAGQVTLAGATLEGISGSGTSWSVTLSATADGTVTCGLLAGAALDLSGNPAAAVPAITITVDTTPPVVQATAVYTAVSQPAVIGTISEPATVSVQVGTVCVAADVTGGSWQVPAGRLPVLATGSYDLVVTAIDLIGNVGTTTRHDGVVVAPERAVTVDHLVIRDGSPALAGDAPWFSTVSVTVHGATYPATVSAGRWSLAAGMIQPGLADGTYDVLALATLPTGVQLRDATADDLVIDGHAPAIHIEPYRSSTACAFIALSGTVSDDGTVDEVRWTDGAGATGTVVCNAGTWSILRIALSRGDNTITINAADRAGNAASVTVHITCRPMRPYVPGASDTPRTLDRCGRCHRYDEATGTFIRLDDDEAMEPGRGYFIDDDAAPGDGADAATDIELHGLGQQLAGTGTDLDWDLDALQVEVGSGDRATNVTLREAVRRDLIDDHAWYFDPATGRFELVCDPRAVDAARHTIPAGSVFYLGSRQSDCRLRIVPSTPRAGG